MIGKTLTICSFGFDTFPVQVEADILPGTIGMQIVGLGDNAIKESRDRIRSAITHSGFEFPVRQIIVNLAPNERPKEGAITELAISAAILIASGQLPQDFFLNKILLGSLSLDGMLQKPAGMLASIIRASQLPRKNGLVLPDSSEAEAVILHDIPIFFINSLRDLSRLVRHEITPTRAQPKASPPPPPEVDMMRIAGLDEAKKGVAYATAGRHHSIIIGPPGAGKTMLARASASIQPAMSRKEILDTSRIYASAKLLTDSLVFHRPFRSPHHTASDIAIVGGGTKPMPGEISLAHNGILFLDELMEYESRVLQSLREPMEDRTITVSRANGTYTFPADFQLIAATNPCRCGYLFSPDRQCGCKNAVIDNLYRKIIGPFLDRIPIEIEARENTHGFLIIKPEKTSAWWKSKIQESANRMMVRNKNLPNALLRVREVNQWFSSSLQYEKLIRDFSQKIPLSSRGLLNTLRLAMTIMDFNESPVMRGEFLEEAFQYRVIHYLRQCFLGKSA